ncbi:hypothetical protein ACFPES_03065 [Paenibacillus sp. GCM10023248]|nr:hypothetical protein [Paenibacillus sp. MAHUQ-63]
MSWERNGRIIHEDEMADYKRQVEEEMIERIEDESGGNANVRS